MTTASELRRLLRPLAPLIAAAMAAGLVGGFAVTAMLAAVNDILGLGGRPPAGLLAAFATFAALMIGGGMAADKIANVVGQRVVATLRRELSARILCAPIDALERYRTHRLITVLTGDIDALSLFAFNVAPLVVSSAIVLGCVAYMTILSPGLAAIAVVAMALGGWAQHVARRRGVQGFMAVRGDEDELQKSFAAITSGAKELRLNRQRRQRLFEHRIGAVADRIRDTQLRATDGYILAKAISAGLFFVLIGIVLLLQVGSAKTDAAVVGGFVLVLLYMKGPIEQVLGLMPMLGHVQVAAGRVAELSLQFATGETALLAPQPATRVETVDAIELRGATYAFSDSGFTLGPIDLTVRRNEILFIVGENGCGKTTLIKLLLALYAPQAGEVLLNGRAVDAAGADGYRQHVSAVFFDYFLFDELIAPSDAQAAPTAEYLRRLEMADKVAITDGAFSTTDLSAGQRKRLALIQVYVEDRPVIVFDEWAAEQDPTFRRIFYEDLLPDLKRQGKTLIVVSHDDRYFGAADRIVRLEGGRIVGAGA